MAGVSPGDSQRWGRIARAAQRYQGVLSLVLLLAFAWAFEPLFFTPNNLRNVLNQVAIPGVLAVGMTFVILTGGIDLSAGSLLGLLNCIAATWMRDGASLPATGCYVLGLGLGIGALSGLTISVTRMQPFVVTLAAMVSLRGIAYVYTESKNISGIGEGLAPLQRTQAALPVPAWILIGVTALAALILARTVFGRNVYAIGGNEEASRLAGVPVSRTRMGAYAINGLCVAVAALLFTARGNNGDPAAGIGYELDAIAAAVVGGCALLGGVGNALGTFVGALFISSLTVLLILQNVNDKVAMGWKGLIILVAVYLQNLGRK